MMASEIDLGRGTTVWKDFTVAELTQSQLAVICMSSEILHAMKTLSETSITPVSTYTH
jgi:hypothetical protein